MRQSAKGLTALASVVGLALFFGVASSPAALVTGGPQSDTLRGTAGPDTLYGQGGRDRLIGRAGDDILIGGPGVDALLCGAGKDVGFADRMDKVLTDCEAVFRGPPWLPLGRAGVGGTIPAAQGAGGGGQAGQDGEEEGDAGQASGDGTSAEDVFLPWYFEPGGADWAQGIWRLILGMLGAATLAYYFLGDSLPSMGGKARVDAMQADVDARIKERATILASRSSLAEEADSSVQQIQALETLTDDISGEIESLRSALRTERWRLFLLGFPLYVLLGGVFAMIFATGLPQALLIGFGWAAVADRAGLRKETEKRNELRGQEIETMQAESENAIDTAQVALSQTQAQVLMLERERDTFEQATKRLHAELSAVRENVAPTAGAQDAGTMNDDTDQ